MFPEIAVPLNHQFQNDFHYKPSIVGYPRFWKPANIYIHIYNIYILCTYVMSPWSAS